MMKLALVLFVAIIASTLATKCETVPTMKLFNMTAFSGGWYEIARYKNSPEGNAFCATSKYTIIDAQHFTMYNTERKDSPTGQLITGSGSGLIPNLGDASKFVVHSGSHTINLWVLDTDYSNYALTFACGSVSIVHYEYGWIWSRTPTISQDLYNNLIAQWQNTFHLGNNFVSSPQAGCQY